MKTLKVRLLPTPEQTILIWKSFGCRRYIYNWGIDRIKKYYDTTGKYLPNGELRKQMTQLKKELIWLSDVGSNVLKQSLKDLDNAYQKFFKRLSNYPKYKQKSSRNSFYVNYESCKTGRMQVRCEKLGWVKTAEQLPYEKLMNIHIIFDGKYYYLTATVNVEKVSVDLTDEIIGVDLGIKYTAVCSNGMVFENINKTKRIKKLEKQLKQKQRRLAKTVKGSKNQHKLKNEIKLIHRSLTNTRHNFRHQLTTALVRTKPKMIVIEDLNVKNMLKNKHLSKSISEQGFYKIREYLTYKCDNMGIELVLADRFYPSSKLCSRCGCKKTDLRLNERVYKCACGLEIDRDLNASYNLANYPRIIKMV